MANNSVTPSGSSLDYEDTDDVCSVFIDDALSVSSDESELSAIHLATSIDDFVIWEQLNGCQEAAFYDIPSRYCDYLTVFNTQDSDSKPPCTAYKRTAVTESYDALLQIAGATKTTQAWSLPAPIRVLSDEDALRSRNIRVLEVAEVNPTAAIYFAPMSESHKGDGSLKEDHAETLQSSMSILAQGKQILFASTVFTSASHISPLNPNISFQTLRRYSRLATTALLRQAHSLQIDTPIFGILLRRNVVAIHVDWYEKHNDEVLSNSAFFPLDDEETDIKTWNLEQPREAREISLIFLTLKQYTHGIYAAQVESGLDKKCFRPWKWDTSSLPRILSLTQLRRDPKEPAQDKMARWRKGLDHSSSRETYKAWLKQRLIGKQAGHIGEEVGNDILSPPSTPGEV
ncbi:hypothetical protein K439DRAFT_1638584 [Ramaria rubella]|nr:hypothetical protein K439DRAFT_1638584 [Ramaria rubella]